MSAAKSSGAAWQEFSRNGSPQEELIRGLLSARKRIPSKYFYDELGGELFEEICGLDEYYPTRNELAIMREFAGEMSARLGEDVTLVELGSGSSTKTRLLLDELVAPRAYVPVDINREQLEQAALGLEADYPELRVMPVWADYCTQRFVGPAPEGGRRAFYFPGSTIGNLRPTEAERFLARLAGLAGEGGALLIGVDLLKDVAVLERAYNDSKGITAQFNLNVLRRVNNEIGTNFKQWKFEHLAFFNEKEGCIEMHLQSRFAHDVEFGERPPLRMLRGETIHTEWSYKYSLPRFEALARIAGWEVETVWTDPKAWFSVQLLRVRAGG